MPTSPPLPASSPLPYILCSRHPSTLLTTALQLTSMLGLGVSLRLSPLYASYGTASDPGPGPGEAEQAISCQLQPHCPMARHGRGLWASSKQSTGENHGGRRCIPLSGMATGFARCATRHAPSRLTCTVVGAHARSMHKNRSPSLAVRD
jgi:hypothetical protein